CLDGIVKNSGSGANRCLVIAKRIPRDPQSWIEIPHGRIGRENIAYLLECPERRVDQSLQRMFVRGGIGPEFITDTDVERQFRSCLPLVVNVPIHVDFAEVTIRVGKSRFGSLKQTGTGGQKRCEAGERVEAAPPSLLIEVGLNPAQYS